VELEVDFKWASNIQVAVLADVGHIGELIGQITEFHFSGSIRVELLPKMPCIPPFGYLRVTFMKKPYVDFSILFGDLDVDIMNVGAAGGYGISGAIQK
jgi:Ca2+-dependent lipid-binding protein